MRADEQKLDIRRNGWTSGPEVAKSISIKSRKRKSSGCASKVGVFTPGDLYRCPLVSGKGLREPQGDLISYTGVRRGQSREEAVLLKARTVPLDKRGKWRGK